MHSRGRKQWDEPEAAELMELGAAFQPPPPALDRLIDIGSGEAH